MQVQRVCSGLAELAFDMLFLAIRIYTLFTCKKQAARFINIHLLHDEVV